MRLMRVTEEMVASIPFPPYRKYGCGVASVMALFSAEQLTFEGPVRYQVGEESGLVHTEQAGWHHVAHIIETGQIVDVCRMPGDRVFANVADYLERSGIVFLWPRSRS
jgi:hypothetical protein